MESTAIQKILVVDDEASYRDIIKKYLEEMGYACDTAKDAFDATRCMQNEFYQFVISDIVMEKKDGLQFMKEAKKTWPHVDFVLMTGYSEHSYSEIIEEGATDFIKKPFELGELKAKIERIDRERKHLRHIKNLGKAFEKESNMNRSIAELSQVLLSSRSIHEISDLVLEHAKTLTGSPIGFAGYMEPQTGHFVCLSYSREVLDPGTHREGDLVFESFDSLRGWALTHKKPLSSNVVSKDPEASGLPPGHMPIERFLAAPALVHDTLVGQIALANADHDYTPAETTVLERIARIYALAIKRKLLEDELNANNAALHEEIQRRIRVERDLEDARDQLKVLLEERTAKLQRAGEIMKSSIERFRSITRQYP